MDARVLTTSDQAFLGDGESEDFFAELGFLGRVEFYVNVIDVK